MPQRNQESLLRTQSMLKTAMGETIQTALADPAVVEIMVNPDGWLWLDRHGTGRQCTETRLSPEKGERIIRLVASHIGAEVTATTPIVSAELPGAGERFEGVLPPVTTAPCFSIRKAAAKIFSLDDYVSAKTLSAVQLHHLQTAVRERKNVLIVGGTGSGKTTLANALLNEVAETGDRVLIIEDTRELQCATPDQVALRTRLPHVSMADLVKSTLRLRPDRIVVGEVRGPEALDMLKAWNTGHPGGISTIHANDAIGGLYRLEQLVGEVAANIPRKLIAQAIDLVVFISGRGNARRIESIRHVTGIEDNGQGYATCDVADAPTNILSLQSSSNNGA